MGTQAFATDFPLFARKGEAMPADVTRKRFRPEPRLKSLYEALDGDGEPVEKRESGRQVSTLSGLIQRRVLTDVKAAPVSAHRPVVDPSPAMPAVFGESVDAEASHQSQPVNAQPSFASEGGDGDAGWRKMTVRLPPDRHRELRELAQLWGTSYQTLLRQAVSRFLESVVTPGGGQPN